MNKIIISIGIIFLLSCEKDNNELVQEQCNCGLVLSDNVSDYSVIIRNNCSGNEKKFYLQEGDWMNAYAGSEYCITNIKSW